MKRTIRLRESELRQMISESVKRVLYENFMDNIKTNTAYIKNTVKRYLPPMGMEDPQNDIRTYKYFIECMKKRIQNKENCGSGFLYNYKLYMENAKKEGYVKYYKIMKQLFDEMIKNGLYEDEHDLNGMNFEDCYNDLMDRVKKRGGYFHG